MDFDLTSDQYRLVEPARNYAERVIRPAAGRLDQLSSAEDFPFDLMREGSALGVKSLPLPRDPGGIDADMVTQCLVAEELAAGDIAAAYFFRHYSRFARLLRLGWPAGRRPSPQTLSPLSCASTAAHLIGEVHG